MSIESILERIAVSAERSELLLVKVLGALEDMDLTATPAEAPPAPVPAPVPTPAPVPPAPPAPPPFAIPMPAAAPAPVPACPIADAKAMLDYCINKYRTLGPVKGGMIQSILIEMGIANINAIPADRYAEFYIKVEAL